MKTTAVELIQDNIFRLSVPLPDSPLKALNAYLVKGGSRHLLIDNGFNHPACLDALTAALGELGVRLADLDLFATHLHADHCGLTAALLEHTGGRAWCGKKDIAFLNRSIPDADYWPQAFARMRAHGFPAQALDALRRTTHAARDYALPKIVDFQPAREGDQLEYGGLRLRVFEVPGHTPGQVSLYAEEGELYFAGDHLLRSISPNITHWEGVADSLGDYLASLDKTARLDIRLTLPGHRALITDTRTRIAELKAHHQERLAEVAAILREQPRSAYETAARMTWSLRRAGWGGFPPQQQWFACGEALAHLEHLVSAGAARRLHAGDEWRFTLA